MATVPFLKSTASSDQLSSIVRKHGNIVYKGFLHVIVTTISALQFLNFPLGIRFSFCKILSLYLLWNLQLHH
jgi:hypothetical protein